MLKFCSPHGKRREYVVNPGSKAAHRGIREGDLISSINGQSTKELTNSEAHGLLKNAGDILRLGLNEETVGSPKRRQYRTVQQETLQETVKKSSITTYSIQKTVETVETQPGHSNENTLSKTNENANINGTSKSIPPSNIVVSQRSTLSSNSSTSSNPPTLVKEEHITTTTSPDNAEASRRSSYTNCTISPSTVSTLSEDGNGSCTTSQPNEHLIIDCPSDDMSDNGNNASRSKKRRQRRKNRKQNENQCDNDDSNPPGCDNRDNIVIESKFELKSVEEIKVEYRVESPVELTKRNKPKLSSYPVKSKSLDDDDMVKIQELSEVSESEEKENQAIVSEAPDSDVEWEEAPALETKPRPSKGTLSTLTLTLEDYNTHQVTLMSPEEETTLRNFLESLNLVNGPEEAAKQVYEKGGDNIKVKKAQKRAALEQYFFPIAQNPRYLDVISEEPSDKDSDREQPNLTKNLKRGTPELDLPDKPPAIPPRNREKRRALPKKFSEPIEQPPAMLVGTKILDNPRVSQGICSTIRTAEASSTVEIVYLDSSESNSPGDFDSTSNDSYQLESGRSSSNEEINKSDNNAIISSSETDTLRKSSENSCSSSAEDINKSVILETDEHSINHTTISNRCKNDNDQNTNEVAQGRNTQNMITCKKDNLAQQSKTYEELSGKNETVTTSTSTKYSFVVKTNDIDFDDDIEKHDKKIIENGIMSQLTPPPTPESVSPQNEKDSLSCFAASSNKEEVVAEDEEEGSTENETEAEKNKDSETSGNIKYTNTYQKFTEKAKEPKESVKNANEIEEETEETVEKLDKKERHIVKKESKKETVNLDNYTTFIGKAAYDIAGTKTNNNDSINSKKFTPTNPVQNSYKSFTEKNDDSSKTNQIINNESLESVTNKNKTLDHIGLLDKEDAAVYTNVVSPPPPSRSPSISSSSSRDSSLCTAKYNPSTSSIADVTSISKEEEKINDTPLFQPLSLRENCVKFLITLPFGADVLQELAEVSLSLESFTSTLPSTFLPKLIPNLPAFVDKTQSHPINDSSDVSVKMLTTKEWVGIPTEKDQRAKKTSSSPDEAGKLIELHEKFLNMRSYQEEVKKEADEKVTITSTSKSTSNVKVTSPTGNRLLDIIREEPSVNDDNESNYLYFVEKESKDNSATLPRVKNADDARLKAKNLAEWLNLARHKSMSESNLNTIADIPENNLSKDFNTQSIPRRRTSLPHDLFERQLLYLQEKEREIQRQLEQLEEEKRMINAEMTSARQFQVEDYKVSRKGDFAENRNSIASRPTSMPAMHTEFFRQQMYEEYMDKFAEREERKQQKVIKVTSPTIKDSNEEGKREIIHPIHIEKEFLEKVKQKQQEGKLGKNRDSVGKEGSSFDKEKDEDEPVLVIDGEKLKGTKQLPRHLQEFVSITKQVAASNDGIWAPGQKQESSAREAQDRDRDSRRTSQDETIPPVWTPKSANSSPTLERKEFRPVNFQSPVLGRKTRTKSENLGSESPSSAPPWKVPDYSSDTGIGPSSGKRIPTSYSSPASGFIDLTTSPRLPKAQNPTITLLQKAREGQLPKGASYIDQEPKQFKPKNDRPPIATPGDVLYQIKHEYTSESDTEKPRKMADLGPRKFEGIGPVTKDGMPLILRSEIKDQNQSKWYKRMYETIHKQRPHNDEYVTVRYRQRRAQYPYTSGYLSEPEPGAYDSDFTDYRYQTLDRRRPNVPDRHFDYTTSTTMPRSLTTKSSSSDVIRNAQEPYKIQPGRIENYTPGHSSISEKEAKEWWDEVMDIFDGHLEQQKRVPPQPRSFINQALKESGYESDSTLVFRRREEAAQQLSPKEQKEAYKVIQKGGDVPLQGLRKPAPERPKDPEPPAPPPKGHHARNHAPESPRKYVENEVTIHYKTPVRQEIKEYLSEDELAHRQAEAMKKIYQEERRKKYLQELQDMNSRRHTDNFIPSQKSPISLNRYDDFDDLAPTVKPRPRSPEPRLVARALYNFVGQTARELTFRKGDLIYVRRQVDKNWYEGELNAMVGLFPTNYVEIVPYDGIKTTPRKAHEGQARAKYNFVAQTHLELSLAKGELVVITRRVDNNWFEGKIGGRKGIFPASYVEVLIDPQEPPPPSSKPVAAPAAHSLLLNGSAGGKESMGTHCYTPSLPNPQLTPSYHAKPVQVTSGGSYGSLGRPTNHPVNQALHIETQSEPVPYRALYKYNPQNDDELELLEGDTVYVLEKCDDGWFVGSSNRTGAFGTFPGNYVEKI